MLLQSLWRVVMTIGGWLNDVGALTRFYVLLIGRPVGPDGMVRVCSCFFHRPNHRQPMGVFGNFSRTNVYCLCGKRGDRNTPNHQTHSPEKNDCPDDTMTPFRVVTRTNTHTRRRDPLSPENHYANVREQFKKNAHRSRVSGPMEITTHMYRFVRRHVVTPEDFQTRTEGSSQFQFQDYPSQLAPAAFTYSSCSFITLLSLVLSRTRRT